MTHTNVRVVAMAALAALALAGCSTESSERAPSERDPGAEPVTTQTAASDSDFCTRHGGISVTLDVKSGGASARVREGVVTVTNASKKPCSLNGYPGLGLMANNEDTPKTLPTEVKTEATPPPRRVVLAPGRSAHATVTWAFEDPADPQSCVKARFLAVNTPDDVRYFPLPFEQTVCAKGRLTTTAFAS